jgi:hypothetical protein
VEKGRKGSNYNHAIKQPACVRNQGSNFNMELWETMKKMPQSYLSPDSGHKIGVFSLTPSLLMRLV